MAFGLKVITYEEDRLDYFKQQLAHQERRLDFAIKHNRSCWGCAEIGGEVAFYQDIVEMLEQQMKEGRGCRRYRDDNGINWMSELY